MPDVDALLGEWMAAELQRDPVTATTLGIAGFDDRLGDFGAHRWAAQADADRHWAGRLAALDLPALPLDEQVDVMLVLTELAGRSIMDDWQAWRRDPSLYLDPCFNGVFDLWLHRLRPTDELVADTVARLRQVPGALHDALANLDAELTPPLLVSRAVDAAAGARSYFTETLLAEAAGSPGAAGLAGAAEAATSAVEDFARQLGRLETEGRGDWAIGEARYSALLRERELLGVSASELHERGRLAYDELAAEMTEVAARVDPAASGWEEVLAALDADAPGTPEAMRAAYEASCEQARDFLAEHALVTLPEGERCLVVPSPTFLRGVLAVASYIGPAPFAPGRTGHFFVPYPPDGESPEGIRERLASNGFHAIPTTAVHEAYPGHHWQLSWSTSSHRPIRKLLTTPYFVEGWALYAERMMYEQGFFTDPRAALSHLGARLFRAARIVVDTALHAGDMSVEEAVAFMRERAVLPEAVARAEVRRYCAWPTQAASYLTGSIEIEMARDRWTSEGRGSLREFHDRIAAQPGLPVALATKLLFA